MKIVEDTPNRLVLKEGDVGSLVFAVIVFIVGAGVLVFGLIDYAKLHNSYLFDAIGLVVAGLGGFLFTSAKSDVVTADNANRQLSVVFKSVKNHQGANQTYSFDDIQSVQLFQHYQQVMETPNNFNNGPGMSFGGGFGVGNVNTQTMLDQSLSVQLKNGTTVTIANEDKQTGLTLGLSINSLVNKGQKLAAVLGVPFNQQGPSTPGQLLQGVERDIVGQPESFVQSSGPQPVSNPTSEPQPAPTDSPMPETSADQPVQSPPDQTNNTWQNPQQ